MRYAAELDNDPRFNAILDAAQKEPVVIEREKKDVAVLISARQYQEWRRGAVDEFQRFCDEISDRAEARGLTEDRLNELLADD